jgi:hypothetical protein
VTSPLADLFEAEPIMLDGLSVQRGARTYTLKACPSQRGSDASVVISWNEAGSAGVIGGFYVDKAAALAAIHTVEANRARQEGVT